MSLARDWTRQLYGAWGAALLAPVTMIAALAVLALGGGFGGLSALGQLLSGPGVPVDVPLAGGHPASRAPTPVLPVVPAVTATRPAPIRVVASIPPVARGGAPGRVPSHGNGGNPTRVGSGGHGAPPPIKKPKPPTGGRPPVTPPAPPAPTPSPVVTIVNNVVATGEAVTNQLPAPLGGPLTNVLQSVGQAVDKLLSPS
jgi:hypothetical protein